MMLRLLTIVVFSLTFAACNNSCSNTSKVDLEILPTPKTAVLEQEGYIVWGASMVKGSNNDYQLYYCRWKGTLGDWTKTSEIVRASSDNPLGPFTPQEVVFGREPEGDNLWYGVSTFNPQVVEFDEKYYIYYSASNGSNFPVIKDDGSFKTSENGTVITQRIGVAVAETPEGPWKRVEEPLVDLAEEGFGSQMCCNPAVARNNHGQYLMVYKCSSGKKDGIFLTVAMADSPTGPFIKTNKKIISSTETNFAAEDPFLWFQNGKYQCVVDDQNGILSGQKCLIRFESTNGLDWERADPFVISRCEIHWEGGELEKTHHLERPQIWLKNGKPAVLFTAVWKNNRGCNVHIPLTGINTIN
ncbi:glycoside hydrolase family protein [Prolixibacteraceae bacterium]|nr:glycoside hydrolase family protein [Prolixibacteraceae bacterium]